MENNLDIAGTGSEALATAACESGTSCGLRQERAASGKLLDV